MVEEFKEDNYWAIVLGGSSGLGLATAQKLAKHGMNICIVHRTRKNEMDLVKKNFKEITDDGVSLKTFNLDGISKEKRTEVIFEMQELLQETKGTVRAFVHSVAKGNLKPMLSEDDRILHNDDFHLTIEAMAISLYDWTQAIFEANMFADDARIISFTSEGNKKAWRNYAAVSAAKTTLEAITRNLALEFAPHGIKANCIQAGVTDTASLRLIPGSDQIKEFTLKRNPNKRLTTAVDVANAAYLLCKDEAAWITGTIIPVDGGEHIA